MICSIAQRDKLKAFVANLQQSPVDVERHFTRLQGD